MKEVLLCLVALILFFGCAKKEEENMQEIIDKLIKVGNYWLYVEVDTAGVPGDTWGFMNVTGIIDTILN